MVLAKVIDKKTGLERTTTPKAYSVIPHRYTLLGYVDENGNPAQVPANVDNNAPVKGEKKRPERSAAVVSNPSGITREDLDRMNAEAIQKAKDRQEAEEKARAAEVTPVYGAPVLETPVYEKPGEPEIKVIVESGPLKSKSKTTKPKAKKK